MMQKIQGLTPEPLLSLQGWSLREQTLKSFIKQPQEAKQNFEPGNFDHFGKQAGRRLEKDSSNILVCP